MDFLKTAGRSATCGVLACLALQGCTSASRGQANRPALTAEGAQRVVPWRPLLADDPGPEIRNPVARDMVALGGERIQAGFDPIDFCTVLTDSSEPGQFPLAVGACGMAPSPTSRWLGSVKAPSEMTIVPGSQLSLRVADVLVVPLAHPVAGSPAAQEGIGTVVHETFHRWQTARALDVPFELRERDASRDPPGGPPGRGSRGYLDNVYINLPGRWELLQREAHALQDAEAVLAAGRPRSDPAFVRAVQAFLEARRARWQLGGFSRDDEETWELAEGTAVRASRNALQLLGYPDVTVVGKLGTNRAAIDDAACSSYVYVLGSYQAAILDDAVGPGAWLPLVYPGRSGAGLSLTEAFEKLVVNR